MGEHAVKRRSVGAVRHRPGGRRFFAGVLLLALVGAISAAMAIAQTHPWLAWATGLLCTSLSAAACLYAAFGGARAKTAIDANEERCRTILRAAMDGFARIDLHGRFLEVNEAYCQLLGYRRDELLKRSIRHVVAGRTSEEIAARIRTVVEAGAHRFETRQRTKDGRIVDLEASAVFHYPARELLLFVRDVRQQREAEQKLMDYTMALEAANAVIERYDSAAQAANCARSEFLANMSREIRTPLTAILGYADLLLEDIGADSAACEALGTIKSNGNRLLAIFNNILDFSQIDAGQMTVALGRCCPAQLIAEVQSLTQARAEAKGLTLQAECLGPVPAAIQTDPVRLRQILLNLLDNAVRFTETGGVRLLAQCVDGEKPSVHFDVVDTGIGMTGEQRARLFHPFARAGDSPRAPFAGTGLGLTISKRLAEMLGGDVIVVESMVGMGTRCRVTIPVGPRGEAPNGPIDGGGVESPPHAALIKLSGRVLVAEDGLDNRRLIEEILRRAVRMSSSSPTGRRPARRRGPPRPTASPSTSC